MGANIESIDIDILQESLKIVATLNATALMNMLVPAIIFYSGITMIYMLAFNSDIYVLKTQLL